jgi:adenine-specific DNA-methyltransferase
MLLSQREAELSAFPRRDEKVGTRMASIDKLIDEVKDAKVREALREQANLLKQSKRFGLVFEEHAETAALAGLPIEIGTLVERSDVDNGPVYEVKAFTNRGRAALLVDPDGNEDKCDLLHLLLHKRIGEPIYPGLTSLGSLNRSNERPYHAVINGENFHSLQLLTYMLEGRVDCIYIDPPYNTGARDWKYNNRYVDQNDQWRHSKWLSFMEKRLRLARRLLKEDGVMIVTIDEHEVLHLGMLVERILPEAYRQMVTVVINPKGVTQGRFSRVEEYAFFCFLGSASISGRGDDLLTPGVVEEPDDADGNGRDPRWKGLLRSGTNARRADRKNMFYPVLVDAKSGAVVGTGDPLPLEIEPDLEVPINGFAPAWPVRKDGSYGNWGVGHSTLRSLIQKGYVAAGEYDSKRRTWPIRYLSREIQEQIASGVVEVVDRDSKTNVVTVRYADVAKRRIKTVWHRTRHDAGVGGTDIIRALLGHRAFSFPKSVYAVLDCLAAVTRDRPNALILDFFAGSGTTLHSTCLLNAEDGGHRRCILVTNNEVEAETAERLAKSGQFPGDPDYERYGVFEQATRPRCEAALTGRRADGTEVPGRYLNGRKLAEGFTENVEFFRLDYLDPDEVEIGAQLQAVLPALWISAGGKGEREIPDADAPFTLPEGSSYGVLFKPSRFRKFREAIEKRPEVSHVWLVTDSEEAFAEMAAALPPQVEVSMLYRDYLRNFRINTRNTL